MWPKALLISMIVGFVLAGCREAESRSGHDESSASAVSISSSELKEIERVVHLSTFQKELLADGQLTLAEYELAALGYGRCVREAGWTIEREWLPTDKRGYSSKLYRDGIDPAAQVAARSCEQEYISGLTLIWALHHRPSEQELQRQRNALGACLRESGVMLPDDPSEADISAYVASAGTVVVFASCIERVETEFGTPFGS
jgi:hypothetical protein